MTDAGGGRVDDANISDDERLFRRIANAASADMITTDPATGTRAPSSGVFKSTDDDGLSVYLDSVLTEAGLGPGDLLRAPNNAVCSVAAGTARENELGVIWDPWPIDADDPGHPRHAAHGLVTGMNQLSSKAARRVARSLARSAAMVIDPGAAGPL